ncbi:MAG: IS66 family transposase [Oligoflexus sp.]
MKIESKNVAKYVLEKLKLVYKADKETKKLGYDDQKRLAYHQKHSAKVMKELGEWMIQKLESGEAEENGPLAAAINYSLKRWTELNEFLYTPGVPLSNAECERTIKKIITHRKNSLFYKTAKGAHV